MKKVEKEEKRGKPIAVIDLLVLQVMGSIV